ncbi:hypothetical protein GC174_18315 [bacterium]|nr:hypothetical protein [bacterium]
MAKIADYVKAGDPGQSADQLWKLYYLDCSRIRVRLAENPSIPDDMLKELIADAEGEVRAAVCRNPRADRLMLERLVMDDDINVRLELAHEPNLPRHLLECLMEDDNPYVRDIAEGTLDIVTLEDQLKEMSLVSEPAHIARVGKLFIDAELISEEDLELCLTMSQLQEIPIGQILIRQKHFTPDLVLYALRMQTLVRTGKLSLDDAVGKLKAQAESISPLSI